MAEEGEVKQWEIIQQKTFTRWANTFLKERMLNIKDLGTDLADGIMLINLLEIISSKPIGKFNKNPKIRSQMLENNGFALNFLKKEGIKLVNIGNEDICDNKKKLILGLIWTIILRYQIHIEEGKSARSDLLQWVRSKIPEYGINNFATDWNDGRAICALGNALIPGLCTQHRELDPHNPLYNANLGVDNALREMDIPKVLDPEDMINPEVDELSVMTYISYFRDWEANQHKRKSLEEIERTTIPEKSRAYGPGVEKGETHIQTYFTIEAINANNRRVNHGGDPFEVTIKTPHGAILSHGFVDNNDGTYTVTYTPSEIGKYYVGVTLHGKNISNSPREVPIVRSPADASKCRAFGPGLEGGSVDEPGKFTIQANNRLGEPMKDGGDQFEVKVHGPYSSDIPAHVVDNKDGTYSVSYTPIDFGDHVVNINLKGVPIADSPKTVSIDKSLLAADASQTIAYGPGLESGLTSELSHFTIEVRNPKGDKIHHGGHPVDVYVADATGSDVEVKIVDNNDGTFAVTYQPREPGVHVVDVVLRQKHTPLFYDHIKDSPFSVPVEAGTDSGQSIAFGPGLEDKVEDTQPTSFTIQARDKDGRDMKKGGDPFVVKIDGPKGPVEAKIKDNGDGTYLVDYQPVDAGKHKVDVTLKGKGVKGNPFSVNVKEGADEHHSGIESYTFTIRAKTKKGENKKDGGDKFKVAIAGPSGPVPNVNLKDNGDGTYLASYKLPASGDYTVDVTLNGNHVKGSPWKQSV